MTLAALIALSILAHAAFAGSRVTVSLYALDQGASTFTVGALISLYAVVPMLLSIQLLLLIAGMFLDAISIYFILPFTPAANPFNEAFDWKYVNYAPILTGGTLLALWIGWHLSAKKWFTGPKTTIDLPEGVSSADEIALEHQGKTAHGGEIHSADG